MKAGDAHAAFRAFPLVSFPELVGDGAVLILAPHPDDESLGCGGLIARAAEAGRPCAVAMMTDGGGSHPGSRAWPRQRLGMMRRQEAIAALATLGQDPARTAFLGLPDQAVPCAGPGFEDAVGTVLHLARTHGCDTIAASWAADPHGDHVAVAAIARAAARRAGLRLLSYPVWGWMLPHDTEIDMDAELRGVRLDIGTVRPRKRAAVASHRSQHGLVVDDDPTGFVMPPGLLDACDQAFEVYIETAP